MHSQILKGQIWYDTADARLKLFNGSDWKVAGGPIVSNQEPNNMVAGDLWIDDAKNRLYFYDGTDLVPVGPMYTQRQGKTGFEADSIVDDGNVTRTVLKLFVGGVLAGVHPVLSFVLVIILKYKDIPLIHDTQTPNAYQLKLVSSKIHGSNLQISWYSSNSRCIS